MNEDETGDPRVVTNNQTINNTNVLPGGDSMGGCFMYVLLGAAALILALGYVGLV